MYNYVLLYVLFIEYYICGSYVKHYVFICITVSST